MESLADTQSPKALKVPQTTIDCVPYEVVHRIIAFVPKKDRPNCTLVNSIFHAIACELDELDKIICFKDKHLSDESIFDSIIATRRRFNKVILHLTDHNINKVPALLQVHGKLIKAMRLIIKSDVGAKIFAIFKSLPNLKKLALFFDTASISNCQVPDGFTMLSNLKHLKLSFYEDEISFGNLFDFITENTVTHLEIDGHVWNGLENLMERQAKSIINLKISVKLFNSFEMYQKMKLKTLTVIETYDDDDDFNSAVDINNRQQIISDHPELEKIDYGGFSVPSGDEAEALLKMKHLKSIDLNVNNENWNKILHEVGRSRIENIHLNLTICDEEKLRIFFNQQYSNIKGVEFKHSINATTEVCNNWKGLTKICLNENYYHQQVNLNFILDNLPNLEILECHPNDSIFIPNGNTYPKIKRFEGRTTTPINLLNALPNLEDLTLWSTQFNVEILRKLAALNISKLYAVFNNQMETLRATDEILELLGVIFCRASFIEFSFNAGELENFEPVIKYFNHDSDYKFEFSIHRDALFIIKYGSKYRCNFPFQYQ